MPERICSLSFCDRPHYARGWCEKHYQRWRKHGDPIRIAKPGPSFCQVDGCGEPVVSHKMCNKHHRRWKKHGDPRVGGRVRRVCSIDGCDSQVVGRGWCEKHYRRWQKHGDPLQTTRIVGDIVARFEQYLRLGQVPDHAPELGRCWIWTGGLDPQGYGKFRAPGEQFAHRWSYTFHVGPIPAALHLDHLCRVRNCANPWHLDPVTQLVNTLRAAEVRYGHQPGDLEAGAAAAS